MANLITLLFVDLAAMLDMAAVSTQAAQLKWDEVSQGDPKPQITWDRDAIGVGVIFLASALKHKKKEYWVPGNRTAAHALAVKVGTKAAKYAADSAVGSIGKAHLQAALKDIFPVRSDEPCPF
jgi:hypothetical protein